MKLDCHLILSVVVAKIHASLFPYKRDPSCIDDFCFSIACVVEGGNRAQFGLFYSREWPKQVKINDI
jgi:hypothetical protein